MQKIFDKDYLIIEWNDKTSWIEKISRELFEEEKTEHECFYEVISPDDRDEVVKIQCLISVNNNYSKLDYRNVNNIGKDVDKGVMIVNFVNDNRDYVESVDWEYEGNYYENVATTNWDMLEAVEARRYKNEIRTLSRNNELMKNRKIMDGYKCQACCYKLKFNGQYIADCHHTKPVSSHDQEVITNIKDLITLCPNCHRLAHTRNPPLTVYEIKDILGMGYQK